MKIMFPIKPTFEVLNSNFNEALVFTPLTKDEYETIKEQIHRYTSIPKYNTTLRGQLNDQLETITGFTFDQIDAIGTTDHDTRYFNQVIENLKIELASTQKRSYKCFTAKDWKTRHLTLGINLHDDGGCSWNCLMDKLKHPSHGIIYKMPIERAKLLKLL